MTDNATSIRAFLRLWGDPTDEDVAFWEDALEPLGDDLRGGLLRAARMCKTAPLPSDVLGINGLGPSGVAMHTVARAMAEQYGMTLDDLSGSSRISSVSHARQHIMAELVEAGFSTPRIGHMLNRDHSTVIHGAKAHRERVEREAAKAERASAQLFAH